MRSSANFVEPPPSGRRREAAGAGAAVAVVILALVACAGCGREREHVEADTPVVLISIDTLRADHLPAYGYGSVDTPAIDRLVSNGIVFDSAYSHSPLTLPSHVSILTGLRPDEHRVRDNVGFPLAVDKVPLVQRAFRADGYRTGGFVSSFVLRRSSGLATGFEVYDDGVDLASSGSLALLQRSGERTFQRASAWLDTVADQPFFLFLHLYEPHSPYDPPEPFASRYASPYDGEIATADMVVGELLAKLDALGLYDRALIVLLSDHGEGLGEHGELEHGVFLYRTTLHVPLVVKLPHGSRAGSRVGATVQLVDVAPTLLKLCGIAPDPRQGGRALTAALDGSMPERTVYSETFYPRLHFGWSELFSLIDARHHFVEAPEPELYDLSGDPGETRNLVTELPQQRERLAAELDSYDRTLDEPRAVPAETLRRLAALGYIGTAAAEPGEALPDPKGQIGALDRLRAAASLFEERRYAEAVPLLKKLVAEQPRILDARDYLARSLEQLGRFGDALRVYDEALAVFPTAPLLALSVAQLEVRLGMFEQAAPLAELAVEADPGAAHALLSQIALRGGDIERAEQQAALAAQAADGRPAPDLARADVLIARGSFEDALKLLDQLDGRLSDQGQSNPDLLRGLSLMRGKALARMGRAAEAEEAFAKEIERFPTDSAAYTHLALMYGLVGMQREALFVVTRLLESNGSPYAVGESIKVLDLIGAREQADQLVREGQQRYPDDPGLAEVIRSRKK